MMVEMRPFGMSHITIYIYVQASSYVRKQYINIELVTKLKLNCAINIQQCLAVITISYQLIARVYV